MRHRILDAAATLVVVLGMAGLGYLALHL